MNFLKNHPRRRGFRNINLKYSNLVNVLQRHLRTDRNPEWIFRASRDTNFENIFTQR